MDTIVGKGQYGSVNLNIIFEKSAIVSKFFNEKSDKNAILKEYNFGIKSVNFLRYYCPNFCYTLGAYCENKKNIIAYEYVGQTSLINFVRKNNSDTTAFLEIFIQILTALEIGQNKISFMQNDLSGDNVIIRDKKETYSVIMGNTQYIFRDVNVPVIIDYGFSSAVVNGKAMTNVRNVGYYGKYDFLIPGYDMYFLLADIYTYGNITGQLRKLFDDIFKFYYREYNPYDLTKVSKRPPEQYANIMYSKSASFTPGGLVRWLMDNHGDLVKNIVSEVLHKFSKISSSTFERRVDNCFENNDSFIISRYFARNVDVDLENIYSAMDNDRIIFKKFTSIIIPINIEHLCNEILDMPMKLNNNEEYRQMIRSYIKILQFMDDLQLYVDLFFMTLEQKIENPIYTTFFQKFSTSELFRQYNKHLNIIDASKRWLNALLIFSSSEPITMS